jgi:nucleotide-binding universal stress UspA family protein
MTSTANVILVPLDGSAFAEAALPYAESLAVVKGRSLRLLSVVETVLEGLFPEYIQLNAALDKARSASAHKQLTRIAESLQERGLAVETQTALGAPSKEILSAAEQMDVAAIVMATHGRGGADRWVMGSVADKVMRMSTKPVLLVRPRAAIATAGAASLRRLLVPLDGSPMAELALGPATELAAASGAVLVLVRVVPYLSSVLDWGTGYVPELMEVESEMVAGAQEALEEERRRLPDTIHSEAVVLRGPPAVELERFIQEHPIDLTVMTTHGYGGISRFVLGSTAERLVHSGAQVLLLRGDRE